MVRKAVFALRVLLALYKLMMLTLIANVNWSAKTENHLNCVSYVFMSLSSAKISFLFSLKMSDSEDPELEEELQAADELLQDMQVTFLVETVVKEGTRLSNILYGVNVMLFEFFFKVYVKLSWLT